MTPKDLLLKRVTEAIGNLEGTYKIKFSEGGMLLIVPNHTGVITRVLLDAIDEFEYQILADSSEIWTNHAGNEIHKPVVWVCFWDRIRRGEKK